MDTRWRTKCALGCALLGLCWLVACGSDDSGGRQPAPSCTSNPQSCPADQTCWPTDLNGSYGCLPAPAGKTAGTTCSLSVGLADCAPGHFCFPGTVLGEGSCSPFCSNGACADGAACVQVYLVNTPKKELVPVCTPSAGTGGAGGMGGASGASGSAGAGGAGGG